MTSENGGFKLQQILFCFLLLRIKPNCGENILNRSKSCCALIFALLFFLGQKFIYSNEPPNKLPIIKFNQRVCSKVVCVCICVRLNFATIIKVIPFRKYKKYKKPNLISQRQPSLIITNFLTVFFYSVFKSLVWSFDSIVK